MNYRLCYALLTALTAIALLAGCQSGASIDEEVQPAESALSNEPGSGVNPELWSKLTAELETVLEEYGTAKRTSAAPTGRTSEVPDLGLRAGGIGTLFEWTYRNQGDYDLNGVVNISDLTQVGLHFEKTTLSPDWQQAQLADGDNNGVVNIADVTPIGQNFGGEVDGYEFQSRAAGSGVWTAVEDYPFIMGDKTTGLYPEYVRETAPAISGPSYRVLPYVDNGSGREYGTPSNVYDSLVDDHCWSTQRGNFKRTSLSKGTGPEDVGSTWETPLEGRILYHEPVSDFMGTIYIGTALGSIVDGTENGYFYALDGDGNVLWRFQSIGSIAMTAATNRQGRVVFGDTSGMVYCLSRDGKQIWRRQLSGWVVFTGPLFDNSGNVFILTQTMTGGAISGSTLYRILPDGTVGWSRATNDSCFAPPTYNTNFDVTIVDSAGELYSYAYDGSLTHNFFVASTPNNNFFATVIMSIGVGLFYADNSNNIQVQVYDGSGSAALALGEDPITAPAINTQNRLVVGTMTLGPDPSLLLNYYDGVVEVWDIVLSGEFMSNPCIDQSDRMYFSTIFTDETLPVIENGINCVLPDQTIAWYYPTHEKVPFAPTVVSDNLLVCTLIDSLPTPSDADSSLLGIRGI
jgi:hypothetical protein